ncbi:hypothetical protein HU200_033054 [Digitaria exilis]|uniref:RBR-type E3 ubiquitin transferase n=1 Tax=Digitaria exilis TaxID=1010633 RepID=A0A835EL42_9POAL|nr:hypothetical protein HU200_033054 [Digitaria exilis]
MAAAAFPSTTSLRTPEPHSRGRLLSLDEASSSSCSTSGCAESSAVACKGGGEAEEGLLDLDCPWVAEAEAESRLEAAAAVLEGLGFCAEDGHEEEEAEIRDNQLRQEDELMALEAIYGDDLVVFENKGGLRYFQIYIRYDVADGVEVCAKLFALNSKLPGQEVMYQWVEWLRNTSRSYLWMDGNITLGTDVATYDTDNRAIPRTKSLESVIPLMLSYISKKCYQAFLEDLHMCMICLNQTKGTKCKASIPPYVLKKLLTEEEFERWDRLLLQKTLDSMSDVVYCPKESGCKLFGAREIAEWERQLEAMQPEGQMRIAMSPIGATVRCPKCRARNFKEDERYIFCWACRASYCTLCRRKVENKKTGHYGSPECMGLDNIDF